MFGADPRRSFDQGRHGSGARPKHLFDVMASHVTAGSFLGPPEVDLGGLASLVICDRSGPDSGSGDRIWPLGEAGVRRLLCGQRSLAVPKIAGPQSLGSAATTMPMASVVLSVAPIVWVGVACTRYPPSVRGLTNGRSVEKG